jgi:hypothetical protein
VGTVRTISCAYAKALETSRNVQKTERRGGEVRKGVEGEEEIAEKGIWGAVEKETFGLSDL